LKLTDTAKSLHDIKSVCLLHIYIHTYTHGLVVSVLATGPKVRGFDPDRGRWIFKGDKNP
jgi:hypothetical protein